MDSDFPCKILTIGDERTGQDFVADIRDCYIIQLVFIRDSFLNWAHGKIRRINNKIERKAYFSEKWLDIGRRHFFGKTSTAEGEERNTGWRS